MKKLTHSILSLIFLLCATVGLVGCGKEKHTHSFTEQKVEQQYLASDATCTESAKYYYSCSCGEKGTETFASGNALGHKFTNYVSDNNATCAQDGTKTAKCDRCDAIDTVADENSKLTHVEGDLKYDIKPGTDLSSATIKESVYCELCKELIAVNSYEITLPSQTFSYDGQSHFLSFEGDEIPERIKPVFVGNEQTSAGDYTVTVGFVDEESETVFEVVLTAELKINKDGKYHEVVFAYDDTAKGNITIAIKHGEKIPESQYPELPQKQGYTVKWFFDDTAIVDDITISILYTPIEYKITYVLDGASNNPRNPHTYTFESPAITLYAPENSAGLSFQGWYTSPNFEVSSRVSTIASGTTGDLTFYAYFLKYKVEAADGFTFDYKSYDYPALTQTVSSTKNTILLSTTIQVSKGCTWTLSRDIEGSDVIKTKNMSLTEGHNVAYITVWYGDDYNLVYYLDVYKLGHRTYSFVADGVTVYPETTVEEQTYVSAPTAPEKPGYTFNGWYALSVNPEDIDLSSLIPDKPVTFPYRLDYDTKFLAIFKPNVYTATYDENGGKPLAQKTENITFDTPFTPVEPERDGYTFIGWQDSEGSVFKTLPQWKYLASETFTAQWELNTYSITYVLNGGTNPKNTVYEYTIEDETIELLAPSRKGYDFCGWFVDADFKNQVTEIAHCSFENKKFYAKWTPIVYEITYVLDGGENDESNPTTYTIESEDITLANPTKTGYTGSWSEGNKLPKGSTGNKIFTAVYTPDVNLSNDGSTVTGLKNTSVKSLVILSEYNGIQVTKIGDSAFKYCSGLTSITIGSGVTSIGDGAFYNCNKLTSVVWNAENCTTAGSWDKPIFKNCNNLTKVTIGENVKTIPSYAFYNCSGLTSITIPDGVTYIGTSAFLGCSGLTSITIPDSVTSIGEDAFNGCSGLKYNVYDNALYLGNESNPYVALIKAKSTDITNCTINEKCKVIAHYAFNGCRGLTSVTIPDGVTSIGDYAFYNCSGITSVTIGNSVTSIGDSAFYNCSGITSVTIGNSVTSIGDSAFYNCSGLTSITIPNSVTSIGDYAFRGCSGLTSIIIGNSVTSIGSYAFSSCSGLTEVIWNAENCTTAGLSIYTIFENCNNLTRVTIGENVKTIPSYVFYGCAGLTSVTIPDNVTSIGDSAFRGCSKLTSITIPDSVTSIGSYAFSSCSGLTSIVIPAGVTSIGSSAFYGCSGLTSITIPDSVTYIGQYVFSGCSGLTSVTIPTSIGDYAFRGCSGLTSVTIGNGVTSIGQYVFSGCSGLTSVTIPDSVTSIGDYAFRGCSGLTSVTIGNGVTSIGEYAFYNCSGLTSVTIPDSVTSIGNWAFENCSGLTSITIGNGVTSIGSCAFENCSGLTSITIGNGVTSIGSGAFYGCSGLITIKFNGTKAQWNAISKAQNWDRNTGKYTIYCTDGNITK